MEIFFAQFLLRPSRWWAEPRPLCRGGASSQREQERRYELGFTRVAVADNAYVAYPFGVVRFHKSPHMKDPSFWKPAAEIFLDAQAGEYAAKVRSQPLDRHFVAGSCRKQIRALQKDNHHGAAPVG